jgi:hypothetical protein
VLNNPLRSIDPNGLILCDYGPSDNGGDDFEDADTADECTNNGGTLPSDQVTVNVNSSATDVPTFENGVQIFPLVCPSGTAAQALSTFNNTVSRVIAGVTAPANFAVGATKVLGGVGRSGGSSQHWAGCSGGRAGFRLGSLEWLRPSVIRRGERILCRLR